MTEVVQFVIPGKAAPAGSKRAVTNRKTRRAMVIDANKNAAPWKADVKAFAYQAMNGRRPLDGPLMLEVLFVVKRPAGHFGTGRNAGVLKESAPWAPTVKPDVLKLARGLEDAMSGVVYRDDSQIVEENLRKRYGEPVRTLVRVTTIDHDPIAALTRKPQPEGVQK